MRNLRSVFLACTVIATSVVSYAALAAERNGVVVSIKPLHSLVSAVMEGVGEPTLIVKGAGSEHVYSLKPSEAEAIEHAKLIFWAGPTMETFLKKPFETLGAGAKIIALGDAAGMDRLRFREGGPFDAHDHGHDDGDDHAHADDHAHEDAGHEHNEYDMHFWLDPQNGKVLVQDIAKQLAESDPTHAAQYQTNADAYAHKLDSLIGDVDSELAPVKDKPFIVFHDAYQYFEHRFGVKAVGSITVSPEKSPGAARITEIHAKVNQLGATCVFSEPQFEPRLVNSVLEGTKAKTGVLDPLGADLKDGPDLYLQLIRQMAASLKSCLSTVE